MTFLGEWLSTTRTPWEMLLLTGVEVTLRSPRVPGASPMYRLSTGRCWRKPGARVQPGRPVQRAFRAQPVLQGRLGPQGQVDRLDQPVRRG